MFANPKFTAWPPIMSQVAGAPICSRQSVFLAE
jgi:hypothetical protein